MQARNERLTDGSAGEIEGYVEAIVDDSVDGWAWRPSSPESRISVAVAVDEQACAEIVADHHSTSLADAGIGDGRYSFSVRLPDSFLDGGRHELLVLADGEPLRPRLASFEASAGTSFIVVRTMPVHLAEPRKRDTGIEGRLEAVEDGHVVGWAWCPDQPTARVEMDVLLDGLVLGTTVAAAQREDLREAGIGDGGHGFAFRLPDGAGRDGKQLIEVRGGAARIPLDVAHRYNAGAPPSAPALRPARYTALPALAPPLPDAAQLGDEGWLFPLYKGRSATVSEQQIQIAVERYEHVCSTLSAVDVPYLLVIAPHKQDVYPELAAGARSPHAHFVRLLRGELRDSMRPEPLDLAAALIDARQHGVLYPRTDSRLNARGAFFAARAVIKEVAKRVPAAAPLTLERARGVPVDGFRGDLIELPRFGPGGEAIDATFLVEATFEANAASLRSIQMPAPEQLALPGHPAPRLFERRKAPQLPRLALMGGAMVDQILPWFAEHSRRTMVFPGHEPPLESLELEAPDAIVHIVTGVELLADSWSR